MDDQRIKLNNRLEFHIRELSGLATSSPTSRLRDIITQGITSLRTAQGRLERDEEIIKERELVK